MELKEESFDNGNMAASKWPFLSSYTYRRKFWGILALCGLLSLPMALFQVGMSTYNSASLDHYALVAIIYGIGYIAVVGIMAMRLRAYNITWTMVSLLMMLAIGYVGLYITELIFADHLSRAKGDLNLLVQDVDPAFISFFMAGIPEEIFKIIGYSVAVLASRNNRTIRDALYLSAIAGASFGLLENLTPVYLLGGLTTVVIRMIWLVLLHASFSLIGCMFLVYMKCGVIKDKWYWYPLILVVPATLHGVYDLCYFALWHLMWPVGTLIIITPIVQMRWIHKQELFVQIHKSTVQVV